MTDIGEQSASQESQSKGPKAERRVFRTTDEILGDGMLQQFIGVRPKKVEYYKRVFQTILEKTEFRGSSLDDLNPATMRKGFRKANSALFRARIGGLFRPSHLDPPE